jgi:hypothetical protein
LKHDLVDLCQFGCDKKWTLLYRGSEDGFSASDFHRKCDGKACTLTVIKSNGSSIFGGYTEAKWDQTDRWLSDPNAFLFSLVNGKQEPIRLAISRGKEDKAIVSTPNHGPVFGGGIVGYDIIIRDNFNANHHSSNLGNCFKHPNFDLGSHEAKTFLAGCDMFLINEIEVFQKE